MALASAVRGQFMIDFYEMDTNKCWIGILQTEELWDQLGVAIVFVGNTASFEFSGKKA